MGKKEFVEVTVKVPKRLMDILEAEDYMGWKREDFFEAAVEAMIGVTADSFPWEETQKFYQKHGKNVGYYTLRSTRVVDDC